MKLFKMNMFEKLLITGFFFVLIAWTLGAGWFTYSVISMHPEDIGRPSGAIVVLTGGGNHRIEAGLELFSAHRAPYLFITGVHPTVSKQHIRMMWKGTTPLPECCIVLGHKATTTKQNAAETLEWITRTDVRSIRLVTSNYHMKRALGDMQAALPEIEIISHPIAQANLPLSAEYFWTLIFSEYHKMLIRQTGLWFNNSINNLKIKANFS